MASSSSSELQQHGSSSGGGGRDSSIAGVVYAWLTTLLWPMYKWLLHRYTGCCEVLRLAASPGTFNARRVNDIERSLRHSKQHALRSIVSCGASATDGCGTVDEHVSTICRIKDIKPATAAAPRAMPNLRTAVSYIVCYNNLVRECETLRAVPYDTSNEQHEAMLLQLWELMLPDVKLGSRVGKHWHQLGFQGDDPKTDFRGMGMLGLANLLYFAKQQPDRARQVLARSHHPIYWFSYAIVGIDMCSMIYHLLTARHLSPYMYRLLDSPSPSPAATGTSDVDGLSGAAGDMEPHNALSIAHVHTLFCEVLSEFSVYWVESKPRDIMEFSRVRQQFLSVLIDKLNADPRDD